MASALHSTPEEFREAKQILNTALVEAGKDPATFPHAVDTMLKYLDEDGDRARRESASIIEKSSGMPFDPESGHYLVGSYQECKGLLARWTDAGARQICLWPVKDPIEQMRRFGQNLAPGP